MDADFRNKIIDLKENLQSQNEKFELYKLKIETYHYHSELIQNVIEKNQVFFLIVY